MPLFSIVAGHKQTYQYCHHLPSLDVQSFHRKAWIIIEHDKTSHPSSNQGSKEEQHQSLRFRNNPYTRASIFPSLPMCNLIPVPEKSLGFAFVYSLLMLLTDRRLKQR
jgi:hypothetical protein